MKSFSQFLQESYLSEEEARQGSLFTRSGNPQDFRNPKKVPFTATDPTPVSASRRLPAGSPEGPKSSPGQLEIPSANPPKGKTTKVRGAAADPWKQFPKKPQQQQGLPKEGPSSRLPNRTLAPAGGTSTKPSLPAVGQTSVPKPPLATRPSTNPATNSPIQKVKVTDITKPQKMLPAAGQTSTPKPSLGKPPYGPSPSTIAASTAQEAEKAAAKTGMRSAGKGLLKGLGKVVGPASAVLDVADERSKGSGWARSLAKGAAVAAGGALGGTVGSAAGPVGTVAGATGGAMAASKAFDVAAGANAVQRKAIATANRQRQAGGGLIGIGGKTTFDTKKNTITTGSGSQRRTAQLGKTSVVTDPKTGKQDVGYLAYKGGKAVYKRADTQNLAQTSSNPFERIGRTLFAGAYKQNDARLAAQKLAAARQSDTARNKALGVKFKPGG